MSQTKLDVDLHEVLSKYYEFDRNCLSSDLHSIMQLIKLGYMKPHEAYAKKWEDIKKKSSWSSNDDDHIRWEFTEKALVFLHTNGRQDYDKGWRGSIVKVKETDTFTKPKEIFVGDIVTGRFQDCDSSRTGNFDNEDDYEFDHSRFQNGPEVRYHMSEDYVTKVTPGEVRTAQVTWTSETGREYLYGLVDLTDGKQMYTCKTLKGLLEYIVGVWWDWRVMQEGEKVTLTVGKIEVQPR